MKPGSAPANSVCQWWEVTFRISMPVTSYRFLLFTSDGAWQYNGLGPQRPVPTEANNLAPAGELRCTRLDTKQLVVIGNRGPGQPPAQDLHVRNGGIPDGLTFTEIFTGPTLTVQNGHLPLPAMPVGIQIWQSGNP